MSSASGSHRKQSRGGRSGGGRGRGGNRRGGGGRGGNRQRGSNKAPADNDEVRGGSEQTRCLADIRHSSVFVACIYYTILYRTHQFLLLLPLLLL